MSSYPQDIEIMTDFRSKSALGVALVALAILTPFSINNFIQGRAVLGFGSLAIVALCALNAWHGHTRRYYPAVIFWGLVPAVTLFLIIAFRQQGIIATYWCYPAVIAFYFMLPERHAWTANALLLAIVFPQAWNLLEHPVAIRFFVTILAVSAFSIILMRVIASQQLKLEQQAVTDPLTGLFNRTLLHETLEQAVRQHHRAGTPMTLLALDLDFFKKINDEFGHDVGDRTLHSIGGFLRKHIRRSDSVFRLGGDEFLALLFDSDAEEGPQVAEKLCRELAAMPINASHPVTVSIGVATLRHGETREQWMKRCDENLYRAKAEGRNRIVV